MRPSADIHFIQFSCANTALWAWETITTLASSPIVIWDLRLADNFLPKKFCDGDAVTSKILFTTQIKRANVTNSF